MIPNGEKDRERKKVLAGSNRARLLVKVAVAILGSN